MNHLKLFIKAGKKYKEGRSLPEKGRQLLTSARHNISAKSPDDTNKKENKNNQKPASKPLLQ